MTPRFAFAVCFLAWFVAAPESSAADSSESLATRTGTLTLINGNTIQGRIVPGEGSEVIRWHAGGFEQPFQFRTGAIKSIKFPVQPVEPTAKGEFEFELATGDLVSGRIAEWTPLFVKVQSPHFGLLRVPSDSIRRLHRTAVDAAPVFNRLAENPDWIALADGSVVEGAIQRFDSSSQVLVVDVEDQTRTIPLAEVVAIKFTSIESKLPQAQCALFLHGGTRLSGDLASINAQAFVLSGQNLLDPVRVPRANVRSMVVFINDVVDVSADAPPGRLGRLELGQDKLTGRLVPAIQPPRPADAVVPDETVLAESALRWHPFGALNAAALNVGASGRIVYRDLPPVDTSSSAARGAGDAAQAAPATAARLELWRAFPAAC